MSRSASTAFWTYVTPLMATRAMRGGLLLGALFIIGVMGMFSGGVFSERFMTNALQGAVHFLIMLALPVAAVLTSEMALRDGITTRTLLYPLLGPVPRITLALVRTIVTGVILALGITVLLLFTRVLLQDGFELLAREVVAVLLGAMAYTAMFGLLHLASKRGLITGLVLLFFFDLPLGRMPFAIRNLSPSYHVGVIADQQDSMAFPIELASPETSLILSVAILSGLAVVFVVATVVMFRRKSLEELC